MQWTTKIVRALIGLAVVVASAASALAQDYVKTNASSQLETRPSGATVVNVNSAGTAEATVLTLPFDFHYYGKRCTTLVVGAYGWVLPGGTAGFSNASGPNAPHGQDATSGAFPYSPTGSSYDANGVVAAYWNSFSKVNDGSSGTGYAYSWVTGNAPNRHLVIAWENVQANGNSNPRVTVQCHLYETTARLVFAYSAPSTGWPTSFPSACGLDSPIDARFTAPLSAGFNTGHPGSDFIFDPRIVTYTGTVLYDRIVSDASGIGNSVQFNVPLPRTRVELRRSSDQLTYDGVADTADDGSFTITAVGLPAATPGSLAVLVQNAAVNVGVAPGSAATYWTAVTSVSFAADSNLGTRTLGVSGDPNGDLRAALHVARVCLAARDWSVARTPDSIPRIDVVVDAASTQATRYVPVNGPTAAYVQMGSRIASNPDVWDDAIITRTYARHVLASIAGASATAYDDRFDAVTDVQNAFGEGFGYYLWAAVSGTSTAIDGTSATTATVHDLETPTITVAKGPDVAACMAGALYDLLDPANETLDAVDGASAPERVLHAVDTLTVAPNSANFLQAWADAGYDAPGITRVFIGAGVLADDALEPNDSRTEASSLGDAGFVRAGLVLNRFNEDWYSVVLPAAASSLMADAKYDSVSTGATVASEIRDAGGALLANGTLIGTTGAVHAQTGPVPAGTYRVGVRYVSGNTVPTYTLQAYVPPLMDAAPVRDWTVGRPYDFALGVQDGIAPYVLSTVGSSMPPGMFLNPSTLHAAGTPTEVGSFSVTIQLRDGGDPANIVSRSQTVVISDVFKLPIAPFVGFPAGRVIDATLPTTGGTPPFTLSMPFGALPSGLSFDANSLHVTGTASPGSSALELDGVDVAGSADHVATRAVVAVELTGKKVPAELATGDDACGWWFDAVKGSTVTFSVATAKGRAKRALAGTLLAPDRSAVVGGKIKAKLGSLAASKFICPESGRFYFVASATTGDATQLLGTLGVTPPKSGKGSLPGFAPADTTSFEVGALPGATLVLKFAGNKKAGLVARVVSVVDPTGAPQPFAAGVKAKGLGGTLTSALPTGGTWTVVLGATSATGNAGKLTYSYAIKQPKGATYSAD